MNKIAKRLVAGASAAALLVSAVGIDQLADLFTKTSYAASGSGKFAQSTGFNNLEQDTDGTYYNTGYGLHTNKTASEVNDGTGRTFDVNLESWYVGENPVDVATILDASGSMAWTVDTLKPLEIDYKALGDLEINSKDDLIALQNQPENGGYLPQDIVDEILLPSKTDDSKLSYADYMYYIYEARSTVSEFVPLGYWDGYTGKLSREEDTSLKGYYNFNDSTNKWKNLKSTSDGKMTALGSDTPGTSDGNNYPSDDGSGRAVQIGKNIDSTHMGMKLDVSPTVTDGTFEFTISFALKGGADSGIKAAPKALEIFRIGARKENGKDCIIKVTSSENALAVRTENNDNPNGGPTNGSKNFDKNYAFYSFVFYKDEDNRLNYCLYKNGGLIIDPYNSKDCSKKGNLGIFSDYIKEDGTIDVFFDTSTVSDTNKVYVDDIYFFDKALTADEVSAYFGDGGGGDLCDATTYKDGKVDTAVYHAKTEGSADIAQISDSLYNNPKADERAGWYYVNSHSNWNDIKGCLESGKQYLGLINDNYLAKVPDDPIEVGGSNETSNTKKWEIVEPTGYENDNKSIATIPSVYEAAYKSGNDKDPNYQNYLEIEKGNDEGKTFSPYENERSIRFYVDKAGYLRCFFCTGDKSWKSSKKKENGVETTYWNYSPRTFCSLVYVKEPYTETTSTDGDGNTVVTRNGNPTKYEELNYALNQFYQNLAAFSDLSNTAVVRFSTHNLISKFSAEEVKDHFKSLIMKDWTNYSDKYSDSTDSGGTLERKDYLQDLLDVKGKTSTSSNESTANRKEGDEISEYPYVMTGGTYTWTGLKAFYDNMVNTDKRSSGDIVYDIANDARDKYLIIFTDGRDNTQDYDVDAYGTPNYDTGSGFTKKDYYNKAEYNPYNSDTGHTVGVDNHTIAHDGDLAEAWADKLKDEGYTIFCVMLATGSISPTANEAEYNRAKNFLLQLAGDKEGKRTPEDCISVVGEGDNTLEDAFADILKKIQLPRNDYTVQDYIDPRFDLVDKDGNLYKLGAGGKITVKGADSTSEVTVGNIIEELDKTPTMTADDCKKLGLAYTPIDSYMVNRKADSKGKDGYDTGDNFGTGYIYYDDEKDMYYLRWTDQIIPMENEAFNTELPDNKKLDVWSATIRLKAKDDFIGGNNILTNGNEAGENLVYSDATIENMDKGDNYLLYGLSSEDAPYREKLAVLSGTDRKINAVDADGVSQAVYGDGIDIPSSGFPRTTVNVRLLPLNANNLSDVIYMGEVVSPTMMLADLENGYMTGSYYLQYLERYAYRVYGDSAGDTPLIELLNQWLKINDKTVAEKTFTIPYMYLPDPKYDNDNNLVEDTAGNVIIENSTGWDSEKQTSIDFYDLNLCDVTGFITYTWKRDDEDVDSSGKIDGNEREPQQVVTDASGKEIYDITKDYVAKNTHQIKYNLQLKFTPLKETAAELNDFTLDDNFINAKGSGDKSDSFFTIVDGEFNTTGVTAWSIAGREDYLKAMIQETRTYEPHVMYDASVGDGSIKGKWVLVDDKEGSTHTTTNALAQYKAGDTAQITTDETKKTVTDNGVYDWTPGYKPAEGKVQLEGNKSGDESSLKNINDYYTTTPNNVNLLGADGKAITNEKGAIDADKAPVSLAANTTYTKDVVNAALALELFIDGKYLQGTGQIIKEVTTYTFDAVRYYNDPIDPPPYDKEHSIGADTDLTNGQKYQLTFKVDSTSLPEGTPQENTIYQVWATLEKVEVEKSGGGYESIKDTGYADEKSLPIGTYVINTSNVKTDNNSLENSQFQIGTEGDNAVNFKYLKIDNDPRSYTYDRFPDTVSGVSSSAATSTKDGEYLIWNGATDNSTKNIAESNREKKADNTYTLTFNFGTVDTDSKGVKGVSVKDYLKEHPEATSAAEFTNDYAKDRLGIIMLSADNNSLAITKEITNYKNKDDESREWTFTVTIKTDDTEWISDHVSGIKYDLYTRESTSEDWTKSEENQTAAFTYSTEGTTHTLTVEIKLTHNQKALLKDLPDGDWQVTEVEQSGVLYTPHNNANGLDEDEWHYQRSAATNVNTLTPISQVDFENEFPYELPSAGGSGTLRFVLFGTLLTALGAMLFAVLYFDRRKKARK